MSLYMGELVKAGKTKDVFLGERPGRFVLKFKDDVTGWKIKNPDGSVSVVEDPGANEVIGKIGGLGLKNLRSSIYYFGLFEDFGLCTHYIDSDAEAGTMLVHEAEPIGHGIECIVRFFAAGSIVRRYPEYLTEGQSLDDFFEVTTKNDKAGDPPISEERLLSRDFGPIMTKEEYDECRLLCMTAAELIREDLAEIGLTLIDLKFEVGKVDGEIVLIDEVSAGIMRVFDGDRKLSEEELADILATRI